MQSSRAWARISRAMSTMPPGRRTRTAVRHRVRAACTPQGAHYAPHMHSTHNALYAGISYTTGIYHPCCIMPMIIKDNAGLAFGIGHM